MGGGLLRWFCGGFGFYRKEEGAAERLHDAFALCVECLRQGANRTMHPAEQFRLKGDIPAALGDGVMQEGRKGFGVIVVTGAHDEPCVPLRALPPLLEVSAPINRL